MTTVNVGNMPFKEAQAFIKNKLLIKTKRWEDMVGGVHAKAFTVAGATKTALLKDLYEAVQRSIDNGTTITTFRKDFDAIVAKHGWSYKGKRGWRTSVIFRTNKRTAYMAGQWQQAIRLKEARPYLQYLTAGDERVRDSHAVHHQKVYAIDDPFWKTHYPPNGWLCRCSVRTLSDDDLEDENLTVTKEDPPKQIEWTDPKTGEVKKHYKGIDEGWDYNVGQSWLGPDISLGKQIMDMPSELRKSSLSLLKTDKYDLPFEQMIDNAANKMLRNKTIPAGNSGTAGFLNSTTIDFLEKQSKRPVGAAVVVKDNDIAKWLARSETIGDKPLSISLAKSFPKVIREPDAILWDTSINRLVYAKKVSDTQYAQWIVKVNHKTDLTVNKQRFNDVLNGVQSAAIVSAVNLIESNYVLVQGTID